MAQQQTDTVWTKKHIESLAPDAASIPAARQVLKKGGFGVAEPTADGRGWWVQVRGLTDSYQVTVRRNGGAFDCTCKCLSYKNPCKHALALLLYLVEHPELRAEAEAPKATAGDFESLVRAVFADPDDDTPRLVFADFLDENGQHDRATLIRYQCEHARLRANSNRYKELSRAIDKLVPKVRKQTGVFPFAHRHTGMQYTFRRGFLHLTGNFEPLDLDAVPARFVNLFRDGWVESITTTAFSEYDLEHGWVPLLSHVAELDLSRHELDEDELFAAVAATSEARATGRLLRIKVHKRNRGALDRLLRADRGEPGADTADLGPDRYFNALTPAALGLLSRSGRLSGASSLSLEGGLGDTEVPALLAADRSRLEALELCNLRLSEAGTAALARGLLTPDAALRALTLYYCRLPGACRALAALGPTRLESLGLVGCSLTDADAAALATGPGLPNLTFLDASQNPELTAAGVAALLASPRQPKLANLELNGCAGDPGEFLPLFFAAGRTSLRLVLSRAALDRWARDGEVGVTVYCYSRPGREFLDALVGRPELKRATVFTGANLGLGADVLPALAAAFDPAKLVRLDLRNESLGNDGAAAVLAAFAGFRLRELSLSWCGLKATGVAAVARGALMETVEKLDLTQSTPGKSGVAALLAMTAPALTELNLTGCDIAAPEQKQLRKHFGSRVKL